MNTGLIFDIKRYSINDGPGIRLTIFLKGCPLRCAWCHNPESISSGVEKMYTASKCIGAKNCIEVCPNNALTLTREGIITDDSLCELCGKCADACPATAIEMIGKEYTTEQLMDIAEKERLVFDQSGGGVTFSGGEPMLHDKLLTELLDTCGERGFHRCVDTTGHCDTKKLLEVAKRTDLFLYDLKLMDSEKHQQYTGVKNDRILHNLQELSKTGACINIRIPFIKGVNTDEKNVIESAKFITNLSGEKKAINLLPYHNIAAHKYKKMGREYKEGVMSEPDQEEIERAARIFSEYNLNITTGG